MDELQKAYEAAGFFISYKTSLSREQEQLIKALEHRHIEEGMYSIISEVSDKKTEYLQNSFDIDLCYKPGESLQAKITSMTLPPLLSLMTNGKNIIKIDYPNGKSSFRITASDALIDVIEYTGITEPILQYLINNKLVVYSARPSMLRGSRKEIKNNYFLRATLSQTKVREHIDYLNKHLGLGLVIECIKIKSE